MTDANQIATPTAVAVLTHVVRSIVDDPDAVSVEETEGRHRLFLPSGLQIVAACRDVLAGRTQK